MKKSIKTQIQNVVAVLLSAVVCAGLLAAIMLYRYSPSGRYLAGNTILSPDVMDQINYKDNHPLTGKKSVFVFNSIEFSYFDTLNRQQHQIAIDSETYKHFYDQVASEQSLQQVPEQVIKQFSQGAPATLTITMRTEPFLSGQKTKIFQVIQFAQPDSFRVQLHGNQDTGEWAYFYRPGIYRDILHLFTHLNTP